MADSSGGNKSSCPCEPLNDSGVSLHKPSAVFMFLSKITLTKILLARSYFYGALCVCQSCSQSFPCAGRTVRNAFLSNGPYPAKDKIHLARIIRYTCLWVCAHGQIDVSSEARPPTHQSPLSPVPIGQSESLCSTMSTAHDTNLLEQHTWWEYMYHHAIRCTHTTYGCMWTSGREYK